MIVIAILLLIVLIIGTVLGLIPIYFQSQTINLSSVQSDANILEITSKVALSINSGGTGKRKRQISNSSCYQYQTSLSTICNGLTNLNQCNIFNLNNYIQNYTTKSVSIK